MIDYNKFLQIIDKGEGYYIDYKIDSNVFNNNLTYPKAELVKDICAMANNGNIASYIVFGVSDDRKRFSSVTNDKLTQDNIQTLCTKSIFPPPKIKVFSQVWSTGKREHLNKRFVIIQIGPQARKAYRLNQDFINYQEKLCHRRNEVWIRRNATTDLATPEEVAYLVKGKDYRDLEVDTIPSINYEKLFKEKQKEAILNDCKSLFPEFDIQLFDNQTLRVSVGKSNFVLKLIILTSPVEWLFIYKYHFRSSWSYEHGTLILSIPNITKRVLPSRNHMQYKAPWGWFSINDHSNNPFSFSDKLIPDNSEEIPFFNFFLGNIKTTSILRKSLSDLLDYIERNDDVLKSIAETRNVLNKNLKNWIKKGWRYRKNNYNFPRLKDEALD